MILRMLAHIIRKFWKVSIQVSQKYTYLKTVSW